MQYVILIISGIIGGVLGGMGFGGGTALIPLLVLWAGMSQHLSQAVNLYVFIPVSILALIIHIKNGLIKFKPLILPMLIICTASYISSRFVSYVPEHILSIIFGSFLCLMSAFMFFSKPNTKNRTKHYT